MLDTINLITTRFADLAWGPWLLWLLLGGGFYFLVLSRFTPFRYLRHAFDLIRGKYDNPNDPGHINHFSALSAALAGTIGMGNIAGVALAIQIGGPGAIFWMWMTAILGIATKFFTCSLAVMYRGKDDAGELQGGPMYVIREALPKNMHFLAYFFAIVAMIGCLPVLQSNQLIQIIRDLIFIDQGLLDADQDPFYFNLFAGMALAAIAGSIIFGGLNRIAKAATLIVPFMAVLYIGTVVIALAMNIEQVPAAFAMIITDAFTGEAVAGGSVLAMMVYGVQRGAFSNEAGMGTESLVHGAVKTSEPIREGLVAMVGPIIDTLIICTATALMILVAGTWQSNDAQGVTLTANAFSQLLGPFGTVIIFISVVSFATTTLFTYSFYGSQCASFLFGTRHKNSYRFVFVASIVLIAVISLDAAVGLIDGSFALMAIPTMVSAIWLAPKVVAAAKVYLNKVDIGTYDTPTNSTSND
ncbi:alanine:cation symporter family protein [Pseudomonadales bacterium]|nr:alanine:cation symporter family protein [Pseudomonadales bacterium]MDA9905422.1 alanine:cation symporter family protein [Pseudomonadales bacterium]